MPEFQSSPRVQTPGRLRMKDTGEIQSQILSGNCNRPSQGNIDFYNENCIKKESHQGPVVRRPISA